MERELEYSARVSIGLHLAIRVALVVSGVGAVLGALLGVIVRGVGIDVVCLFVVLLNHLDIGWFVRIEDWRRRIITEMKNLLGYGLRTSLVLNSITRSILAIV